MYLSTPILFKIRKHRSRGANTYPIKIVKYFHFSVQFSIFLLCC